MTRKRKGLIALMALSLTAGVGSALAISVTPASGKINGSSDGAIYFTWDQNEITEISDLKGGVAQYTSFSASVESTKNVAGWVTIGFELEAKTTQTGKTAVLKGLTVSVYATSSIIDEQHSAETLIQGLTPTTVLDATTKTGDEQFQVTASNGDVHTTRQAYVLKFLLDEKTQLETNEVLDGQVNLTASFN